MKSETAERHKALDLERWFMEQQRRARTERGTSGTFGTRSFRLKLFYGIGSVAFGVKDNGFSVLLLLFYNQAMGLDARLAGLAIMIALIVDAVADPLIGYASDNISTRWGRRHPFMYAAAIPVSVSYLFLFSPPTGLSQAHLFAYLLVVAIIVRVFISLYEIPSAALIAELTDSYDERTSYLSFRFFFGWIGGLTMSLLAFSVFLRSTPAYPTGQLNVNGYGHYGIAAAVIMFSAIIVSSLGTQPAIKGQRRRPPRVAQSIGGVAGEIIQTLANPSALSMLIAGMLVALSTGLSFALVFYFYTYFWQLQPSQISILIGASFVAATIALMITPALTRRSEKKSMAIGAAIALIVLTPIPYLARLAGLFPANGASLLLPTLFAFSVVVTMLGIVWTILLTAMLADVVEDNQVRTGKRSEGVFFAANTFVAKCVSGLGVFASGAILAVAGFPAHAEPGFVPDVALRHLTFVYVGAITLLNIAAIVCVMRYRITRASHQQNLDTLASQAAETPAAAITPTG